MTEDILSLIPQRRPFVMIDTLVCSDDNRAITVFRITEENIFVAGGEFLEPGLVENIAQTAAAGAGYSATKAGDPVLPGYIGSIKNLRVEALPKINDELTTETIITDRVFNVTVILGKVFCNKALIAHCEMKIFTGQTE